MKNVIIVNDFDYVQGGASKVAIDTARLLKEQCNVVFFSAVSTNTEKIDGVEYISTGQYECLKDPNKLRGLFNGLYNFKSARILKKLLKKYDTKDTIVHVHGWTKALSSSIFRIAFKMKFNTVVTLHDYFTSCPNGGYFNYKTNKVCSQKAMSLSCAKCNCDSRNYMFKLYRLFRQWIQNHLVKVNKRLKYAIGISDLNIEVLKEKLPNAKIVKIQNPIELNLEYLFQETNDYFLYLGRVSKEKGVEIFADAITKCQKKGIVVGDGPELQRLKNKYPNIEFVGWKNKEEVNQYLKSARALIMPSLWYEGAPLTPLEAMSFGVPCIISKICSGREYITDNGFIFDPYDENDLIQKIELLEKNIVQFSQNSFEYIKQFDKSNYLNKLISFYNHML